MASDLFDLSGRRGRRAAGVEAGACVFLACEASSFVNGAVLYVAGGISVSR